MATPEQAKEASRRREVRAIYWFGLVHGAAIVAALWFAWGWWR